MLIEENCYKIKQKNNRYKYYCKVTCDSIHHIGEREQTVLKDTLKKTPRRLNQCSSCYRKENPIVRSEEYKKHLSESRKGNKNPHYGKKLSIEHQAKLHAGIEARVFTPEYRKKISYSIKGEKHPNWNPNRQEIKNHKCLQNICRRLIRDFIKNRPKYWGLDNQLGYSCEQFKKHIESTWEPWMNWENYGPANNNKQTWCIDHIKPVHRFFKEGIFELSIINSLNNLRALDSKANCLKREKYKVNFIDG